MTDVRVELTFEGGRPFTNWSWTKAATEFSDEWGPIILRALKAEAPHRSGRLEDSLHFMRETSIGSLSMTWGDFYDPIPYFGFVLHGTQGGQTIVPVAARALHWKDSTGDHFAMSVIRGATPANDFPQRVWDRMRATVEAAFASKMELALGGL